MRRPELAVRLMGSTPVVYSACIALLILGVVATQVDGTWPLALVAFAVAGASTNAEAKVRAFRLWESEWGALGEPRTKRKRGSGIWGLLSLALVAAFVWAPADMRPAMLGLVATLMLFAGLGAIIRSIVRRRQARTANAVWAVKVCISAPIFPPIPLERLADALPEHCQRILTQSRS